jgi:hypothetical protein
VSKDPSGKFLIALGRGDIVREAIHELIKEHAGFWWHHLPDIWIVDGHDHKFWGNLLQPVVTPASASLLVLELPREEDERMFAVRGAYPTKPGKWLWESYFGRPMPD